jgi:hypothetical protein
VIKNEAPTRFRAVLSCGRIKITTGVLPVFTSQEPSGEGVCVSASPGSQRRAASIEDVVVDRKHLADRGQSRPVNEGG